MWDQAAQAAVTLLNPQRAEPTALPARQRVARAGRRGSSSWIRRLARAGGAVFVDLLPFVVVVLVQLPVRTGNRLRGLVRLEARVEHAFPLGRGGIAKTLVAQHQIVVRLQIFGIYGEDGLELFDRRAELPLEE